MISRELWESLSEEQRGHILESDLASYIRNHYGTCIASKCNCLKTGWLGINCPHWIPVSAKNWDELKRLVGGK